MLAAVLLYAGLFFSLGALVSVHARSSAGALMILLFLWASVVFAIPSLGNLVAEQIRPVPSAETQEMLRREEFAKNRFLEIQAGSASRTERIGDFNRSYDRLIEDYRARLDSMVSLSKAICRISPAATLSYIFTDLAGTGLVEQRRLNRALMEYKARNLAVLRDGGGAPPVFEFARLDLAQTLERGALTDLAALALTGAVLFALCIFGFLRLDPR